MNTSLQSHATSAPSAGPEAKVPQIESRMSRAGLAGLTAARLGDLRPYWGRLAGGNVRSEIKEESHAVLSSPAAPGEEIGEEVHKPR